MAAPTDERSAPLDLLERLALAALGAVALTGDRVDELADELSARGAVRRDEARELILELSSRWRGDAVRVGERAGASLGGVLRELGLVTRHEYEELELRVAQLEHRLRLVEGGRRRARPREPARARPGALGQRRPGRCGRRMRYVVPPVTLWLAPSYGYGAERIPPRAARCSRRTTSPGSTTRCSAASSRGRSTSWRRPSCSRSRCSASCCTGRARSRSAAARPTATRCARPGEVVRERRHRRRPRRGHAAAVRPPGPGPARAALSIAIMEGVPVIPCALDTFGWTPLEPPAVRGRVRRADLAGRHPARPRRLRARRASSWAPSSCASGGSRSAPSRDGFPPVLADGALRNGPVPPGWRPPRG